MKIRNLFAALPLLGASLWAGTPALHDLVLPEKIYPQLDGILKRAVQQSPQMVNRALDLEVAENNRIQARANILPSVNASARYAQASDDRADLSGRQNVAKIYYDLSVSQPLFHWGERRNNVRIGEIQQKISEGNYRDGYRLLAQEIRSQYLYLVVRKTALERSHLSHKYSQDVLQLSEERLAKKVMSEAEIFPVRLNAERVAIEYERAQIDYEAAKQSFARLTGERQLPDAAIPDRVAEVSYTPAILDGILAGFLAQKDPVTNVAVSLRSQLEIENLNYQNQQTRLRPKLNFVAGITQDEQSYSINVAQKFRVNSLYAGVSLSWSIFDGFASGAATRSTLARRRQLENDYRGLTDRLAREAQSQVKLVNFSARGMSIADRILVAAAGSFNAKKAEFARGVVSENDVTQANLSYYEALINADNSRIDYLIRVGEFLGTVAEDPVLANLPVKP